MEIEKVELVDYWKIPNTAINATHEISFLETPHQVRKEYEKVMENGDRKQKSCMESKVKNQIVKRKQVMQSLHKEIRELEEIV